MSHARRIIPGQTLVVARRCSEQRFFLKAGAFVNRAIAFLLAHYATKHGIHLHGFVFMSNHFHLVLTDPKGKLPTFMGEFDSMLSRVLNHRLGRRGSAWESTYTALPLATQEDVLGQLAYLAANPVEAGVVESPDRWPGLISLPNEVGSSRTSKPPSGGLFGRGHKTSALPATAELELTVPPHFKLKPPAFATLFRRALRGTLTEIRTRIRSFKGAGSVKFLHEFDGPRGDRQASFDSRPALSNATPEERAELKLWRTAHRDAFYRWQTDKSTVFPAGTWQMVQRHKARVVPHPD